MLCSARRHSDGRAEQHRNVNRNGNGEKHIPPVGPRPWISRNDCRSDVHQCGYGQRRVQPGRAAGARLQAWCPTSLGWHDWLADGLLVCKYIFLDPASQHEQCRCEGQGVCARCPEQGGEVVVLFTPGTEVKSERTVWHSARVWFMKCAIHRDPSDCCGQHSDDNGFLQCAHGLRLTLLLRHGAAMAFNTERQRGRAVA